MAHRYQDRIAFVGVAGHDRVNRMEDFVARHDLGHVPHAITEDGSLWLRFEVNYQPAWILVAPNGEIVLRAVRPSMDAVTQALDELAGAQS